MDPLKRMKERWELLTIVPWYLIPCYDKRKKAIQNYISRGFMLERENKKTTKWGKKIQEAIKRKIQGEEKRKQSIWGENEQKEIKKAEEMIERRGRLKFATWELQRISIRVHDKRSSFNWPRQVKRKFLYIIYLINIFVAMIMIRGIWIVVCL